jgi:hypothetical protein
MGIQKTITSKLFQAGYIVNLFRTIPNLAVLPKSYQKFFLSKQGKTQETQEIIKRDIHIKENNILNNLRNNHVPMVNTTRT